MLRGFLRPLLLASLALVVPAVAPAALLMSDTFNGQNGSRPVGWSVVGEPGNTFWALSDNRIISGDHSKVGKSEPLLLVTASAGSDSWSDYFGSVDYTFLGASGGVIGVVRYTDPQNYYEVGVFSEGGNRYAKIDKIYRGVRKTLARVENSPANPVPDFNFGSLGEPKAKVLRAIVVGNEIGLQAGIGSSIFRLAAYDSDPLPPGKFGFGVVGGSAIFDNAIVKDTPLDVFVKGSSGSQTTTAGAATPAVNRAVTPSVGSSSANHKVQVASGLTRERADNLVRTLTSDGYSDAVISGSDNSLVVTLGTGLTRDRADQLFQQLRSADYSPEAVVTETPAVNASSSGPAVSTSTNPTVNGAGRVYRVQVFDDFPDSNQATAARETLIRDDYANVDIVEANGSYQVILGNFASSTDAEQVVANLIKDAYPKARVIEAGSVAAPVATPVAGSPDMGDLDTNPQFAGLPAEQQQRIRDLVRRSRAAEAGTASAREMLALREETKALQADVRLFIQSLARSDEERREKEGRIRDIYRDIDGALSRGDIAEAERQMTAARMVYPDYGGHSFKEQRIRELKAGGAQPAVTAAPQATPLTAENQQRVTALLAEARQSKAERRNEDALVKFQQVLAIEPGNREALEEVRSLPAIISSDRLLAGDKPGFQTYLLYGGISFFVVMFGVIGFVLLQNIRRERELIKQVSQMQEFVANQSSGRFPTVGSNQAFPIVTGAAAGLTPEQFAALQQGSGYAPALGSNPALGALSPVDSGLGSGLGSGLAAPSSLAPALSQPPSTPIPGGIPPGMTGGESSTTVPLPFPGPPPRGPLPDEVRLSGIPGPSARMEAPVNPPTPPPTPAPDLPPPPAVSDAFAIPGLTPDFPQPAPAVAPPSSSGPAIPALPPLPSVSVANPASDIPGINELQTVFMTPPEPSVPESSSSQFPPIPEIPGFPPPLPAQPTPTGFDSAIRGITPAPPLAANQDSSSLVVQNDPSRGIIFVQSFDDETADDQPSGWQGDYDYASLTVDRSIAAGDGGGQSLKFEKRTGAGSANYVCKFPKASGQVRIEFDIRCDDKNKYLLGFYIEKDEDFKQSIHTIIHRMDSKSTPSLRVQGEPVPYEFGTWRHMTYVLNLPAGLVTAYVDGEQVIKDARLPTAPSYVNTLSIRDNLATTGILYLDNITVSKA